MAGCYDKILLLGSGSYGKAWVVNDKAVRDQKKVLKEIKLSPMSDRDIDQAVTEVSILARCRHDNVIEYTEAFVDREQVCLSIVMEFASGGDLHQEIARRRGLYFPVETILSWFTQLLSAISYIHNKGILHRDIKPQNLFLTESQILKLGDFGISKILKTEDSAHTFIGTPFYLSPEICKQLPYNHKSDVWAAGCVLYELCSLHVPFTAASLPSLTAQIERGVYAPLPSYCGKDLNAYVKAMLTSDPEQRPSAQELWKSVQNASNISNSETYTVVRYPKVRRLSVASPELSALVERQRTLYREGRRPMSADPPVRKGAVKRAAAPRLNLLDWADVKKPRRQEVELQSRELGAVQDMDFICKAIYKAHMSSESNKHQALALLENMTEICGGDNLGRIISAHLFLLVSIPEPIKYSLAGQDAVETTFLEVAQDHQQISSINNGCQQPAVRGENMEEEHLRDLTRLALFLVSVDVKNLQKEESGHKMDNIKFARQDRQHKIDNSRSTTQDNSESQI